jgi:Pentapeptide repeats (8 copies)
MADEEHLFLLKQRVEAWNEWRLAELETRPDLSGADLSGANLSEALIKSTNLVGTSFEGANVSDTVFADLDFSSCAGLDSVRHYGPSTLGFDSIIRSKGRIPAAFLRGVGAIVDWTC